MERLLFFIYLYEGKEAEYDKRHDELWPEMAQALTESGWSNYTLFRNGTTVVGYCEAVPDVATAARRMGATEVNARWQESLKQVIKNITDRDGKLLTYREMWHHN